MTVMGRALPEQCTMHNDGHGQDIAGVRHADFRVRTTIAID